ncbi:hypothetical protein EV368DRAFT_36255, partial [Lentinula lateritia]
HFEDNPLDLEYPRHDKPLHPTRIQPHMKHVLKYLLPKTAPAPVPGGEATGLVEAEGDRSVGFVPFKKRGRNRRVGGRGGMSARGSGRGGKKKSDPLKKFGR